MRELKYPVNNGIEFDVDISESAGVVTVPDFVFALLGVPYNITGGSYTLACGDVLYITPQGLEHCVYTPNAADETKGALAPVSSVFESTHTAYWLVSRDAQSGEFSRLVVA